MQLTDRFNSVNQFRRSAGLPELTGIEFARWLRILMEKNFIESPLNIPPSINQFVRDRNEAMNKAWERG